MEIKKSEKVYPKYVDIEYDIWIYDVWGNSRDGYDVNDRSRDGSVKIRVKAEVFNADGENEFASYCPTDRQLARALGWTGCQYEWQDGGFDITLKRNGRPVGQLEIIDKDD